VSDGDEVRAAARRQQTNRKRQAAFRAGLPLLPVDRPQAIPLTPRVARRLRRKERKR